MLTYFPPIQPYATHKLPVQSPHEIYVEECGNPEGIPVLFLHGGPGTGCSEDNRRLFDPSQYRIILFDQRGAGRSTPYAELRNNNTAALLSDIEHIRKTLQIERWVLLGGSWGATLALLYAEMYPERVLSMVVGAAFLGRVEDRDWLYGNNGLKRVYPDYWQEFASHIPKDQKSHLLYEYHQLLTGSNEVVATGAAVAWAAFEAKCATLLLDETYVAQRSTPHKALAIARLECHYFINNCFLEPNQILRNLPRIADIPAFLIHGRNDMICPFESSWLLHQGWPASELYVVPGVGHSVTDPDLLNAYILATNQIASFY
ncbi:MAG: prolyl aminopeptidase [Gammaproteobacteria bacterium]